MPWARVAVQGLRGRVVAVEFVGVHGPELAWEQPYDADVEPGRHP
jgi:hypothetical protein